MKRSHVWGFLTPLFLGLVIALAALASLGLPMAIILGMFGTDPIAGLVYVVMSDRGTLAGVTGAGGVTVTMWLAHLVNRRIGVLPWLGVGVVGYAAGALAILLTVPQMTPAG